MSEVLRSHEPRLALAGIFRNERPYIVEWLAFHKVIGVDTFYIADNGSDDGSTVLLQALERLGLLKWVSFPSTEGQSPQLPAYAALLNSHLMDEEWVAFIDADEFIMPQFAPWNFKDILRKFHAQSDVGALVLNWALYGSGWRFNHSSGLVIERFDRRAHLNFSANLHYKTVLRRSSFDALSGNPHHFRLKPGYCHVQIDGKALTLHPEHGEGVSQEPAWDHVRLHHYIVKSKEEFTLRKQRNGSAASLTRVKDENYFIAHDRNDKLDPIPLALLTLVKAEVDHIQRSLSESGYFEKEDQYPDPLYFSPFTKVHGAVDSVELIGDEIHVRGWVFLPNGQGATQLLLRSPEGSAVIDNFRVVFRPDVQRQYPMASVQCGFYIQCLRKDNWQAVDSLEVLVIQSNGNLSEPLHQRKKPPFPT